MRFHHIGIACEDIPSALEFAERSFPVINKTEIIFDKKQAVNLCLLTLADGTYIELVSGSTVSRLVEKKQFLYHTCWEVDNLDRAIAKFYENGAMLISTPKKAVLFNDRKVAFLFTDLGIMELLESVDHVV